MVAASVLTCEKFTNVDDIAFSRFMPLSLRLWPQCTFTHLYRSPYFMASSAPYVYCLFPLPRISFWPLSAINTVSDYAEINSGSQKQNSRRHFCFFSLVIGIDVFQWKRLSKSSYASLQRRQSKYQVRNIRTYVYSNFVFVTSTFNLFNYGTPAQL